MASKQQQSFPLSLSEFTEIPGVCGLSNLSNTCCINSVIQCLSNVSPLTKYFLSDKYKQRLNRDNQIGRRGALTSAYGELMHQMWSGRYHNFDPEWFKINVIQDAPEFGDSAKDSEEFMSFLLESLHEDLNLVKNITCEEKKDDGKLTDAQLATTQWNYYQQQNGSKIHDIFHGQIKSTVTCLTCNGKVRTFDPFRVISLPPPREDKMRTFIIDYVRLNGKIKAHTIECDKNGCIHDLIRRFCERFQSIDTDTASNSYVANHDEDEDEDEDDDDDDDEDQDDDEDYDYHQPKPDLILPAEVHNHQIHLKYSDDTLLTSIFDDHHIVFYETPHSLKEKNDTKILLPCIFRNETSQECFGLPVYLSIPKYQSTGRNIRDALQRIIYNLLPLSQTKPSEKPRYTAKLVFGEYKSSDTIPLQYSLNDYFDLRNKAVSLVVDVAPAVVDRYKQNDRTTSADSDVQKRRQQKETTTLLDCFESLLRENFLREDKPSYCPRCKQLKKAKKKLDLWLLPKVLILQLPRFNYTRYFSYQNEFFIDCPIRNLDLTEFVVNPAETSKAKYELIAVNNHIGDLNGGHYTTNARNALDENWYNFDDSKVSKINENDVITKSAYILIYQRQKQRHHQN